MKRLRDYPPDTQFVVWVINTAAQAWPWPKRPPAAPFNWRSIRDWRL